MPRRARCARRLAASTFLADKGFGCCTAGSSSSAHYRSTHYECDIDTCDSSVSWVGNVGNFKVFLIGSAEPLDLEFPVDSISSLQTMATHSRFIIGRAAYECDECHVGHLMIPTSRIQLILER